MACVEVPNDRKVARQIADGEYEDRSWWTEGEERRRRFGRGDGGELGNDEKRYIGGVGEEFRWRRWRGLEKELRAEMKKRGELVERDVNPQLNPLAGESSYSVSDCIRVTADW